MITRKDSLLIGKAIVVGAKREIEISRQISHNEDARIVGARGSAYDALQNIWYDVLPTKVKESFDHTLENYLQECGWKDLDQTVTL